MSQFSFAYTINILKTVLTASNCSNMFFSKLRFWIHLSRGSTSVYFSPTSFYREKNKPSCALKPTMVQNHIIMEIKEANTDQPKNVTLDLLQVNHMQQLGVCAS